MIKTLSLSGVLLVVYPALVMAQSDSLFVADAKRNAIDFYTRSIGVQSHLFNGSEYKEYISQRGEFPYLYEDEMTGTIRYAGQVYEKIPLYYDLEKDQVITSYTYGNKVQLLRDMVDYFDIGSHRFVRLDNGKVPEGFYDLLYDGTFKFYARREKHLMMRINGNDPENYFEERVKYLIFKNGVFHTVKSKGSVMALLKDKKKYLKKTMKEGNMKFRRDREKVIIQLMASYEKVQ